MRIIQENISGSMYRSGIFEEYFPLQSIAVADIETTGLSPRSSQMILGGLIVPDGENRLAVQYFADRPENEAELLERYVRVLTRYETIVTYNGSTFDIPFLKKRMRVHRLDTEALDKCYSFDLYRMIRKYSELPSILPDLKQKTVEKYMGAGQARTDQIDGAQSVRLYEQYLESQGPLKDELLDQILLHNRDDIVKLSDIMSVLRYLDLHHIMYKEGFPVSEGPRKALIQKIHLSGKEFRVEGAVSGRAAPYRGFSAGEESEVNKEGAFQIRIHTENVEEYLVADLRALGVDNSSMQVLPGYESGYLILRNPEKQIQYHEANRLAAFLAARLMNKVAKSTAV